MDSKIRRPLPTVTPTQEKLGQPTIMDRALAARHGVAYVHLAVFAIDVDRIRAEFDARSTDRPLGWDVFLTEVRLLELVPQAADGDSLLEDTVLSILDGDPEALGSQLVFAVWDAIERGVYPKSLRSAFRAWRTKPKKLTKALQSFWADPSAARQLAREALEVVLEPPIAPPTRSTLEALAADGAAT